MKENPLLPAVGDWVGFVLQGGRTEREVRKAKVIGRFVDETEKLPGLCKKYGRNEEEVCREFGMYVNLIVLLEEGDLSPEHNDRSGAFEINGVRHSEKKMPGTYHFLPYEVVLVVSDDSEKA